ncbi:7570_t:CDS:2, partial [Ambispora gerdemannii]
SPEILPQISTSPCDCPGILPECNLLLQDILSHRSEDRHTTGYLDRRKKLHAKPASNIIDDKCSANVSLAIITMLIITMLTTNVSSRQTTASSSSFWIHSLTLIPFGPRYTTDDLSLSAWHIPSLQYDEHLNINYFEGKFIDSSDNRTELELIMEDTLPYKSELTMLATFGMCSENGNKCHIRLANSRLSSDNLVAEKQFHLSFKQASLIENETIIESLAEGAHVMRGVSDRNAFGNEDSREYRMLLSQNETYEYLDSSGKEPEGGFGLAALEQNIDVFWKARIWISVGFTKLSN